ncbi:ABC transporter permease [Bacteroidota bacterium]
MIRNYLKIALRNIRKHKGYSFINIFGFAAGITCCLLITMYVMDELSYDKFYPNAERIYRVAHYGVLNDRIDQTARTSPPLAQVLAEEFPEVEAVAKCRNYGFPVFRYKDKVFSEERVFSVDTTFFNVFKIPFIKGTPETALDKPDAIVLTRSMAAKYFGNENPIGKIINSDNRTDYMVTAVVEDIPGNSHFHFDFLRSLERYEDAKSPVWVFNDFYTYVLLRESVNTNVLEEKLFKVVKEKIDPFLRGVLGISADEFLEGGGDFRYYFQPLTDIHLHSHLDFELEPNGDIAYVYIFSTIALGILLIACFNFINLATARSSMRAREVGIRKTLGSTNTQIMRQFLTETVIMTILAVCFAWLIAYLILPVFNQIAGKNLTLPFFTYWWGIPLLLGFALLIGIVAGFYPAFFLSSFQPVWVLKGEQFQGPGRSILRTSLVVVQFSISAILIIATITIGRQMAFIKNTNLGFDKDQVVVIKKTDDLGGHLTAFKEELLKHHGIVYTSNSEELLGNHIEVAAVTPEGHMENQAKLICYMVVDPDFLDTYDITLKEGRFFEKGRTADEFQMVLNETAVKAMGLKDPVGKRLVNSLFSENQYPIIGVVGDFHFQSLRQRIQPMVFATFTGNPSGRYLSVRISPENVKETLQYMKDTWQTYANGQAFEYEFFDKHFERIYLEESQTQQIFLIFSILAIIIACLGLFSLSAFISERRTKEVGIRKALGSSTSGVIYLLVIQFLKWVIIANLIAWPIAWFAMSKWLQGFAYHIGITIWTFILSTVLVMVIALLTVSYQAVKAAQTNPVDSLRHE